ncbi:type I glutamate--ammonia ligase [Lentilactobacillus buchneri]|uniref:type I glutamate--ammonia ligase n=1 Tax=Lentilactobacillus buchneri TaxID=1581 RepID=UPI001291B9D2|nr:type I glutamate--ammonia ligase [Lentilactobacillus buchneri]MQN23318.1 type I glutamate--ammonia ligase [Lentilactobacillus buchneri]
MYSADDVRNMAKDENVKYLRMTFTDVLGALKNIEIPISSLDAALNNQIKIDGSSIEGFLPIEHSDMLLYPDPDSWEIYPWIDDDNKTAAMICDVHNQDGSEFPGDPRTVLKDELAKMNDKGIAQLNIGAEPEFFLFKADEDGNPTMDVNDDAFYFDVEPKDKGVACRRAIVNTLNQMNIHCEADHHEAAAGQHEVDFKYADALKTADDVQMFKLVVKEIASRYGLAATFMPKPITGINGSGEHFNMSLFDKDGNNDFYDKDGKEQLSDLALNYLGGVLKHAKAITAIANPTINSYKRLVPGYEAPTYIAWGTANRTPLVRVPSGRGIATRLELRSGDPSCNAYLAIAAALAAGLDGIDNKIAAPDPVDRNIYDMTADERKAAGITQLPGSLTEALDDLEADKVIVDGIGDYACKKFVAAKRHENEIYRTNVSPWEHSYYFDC